MNFPELQQRLRDAGHDPFQAYAGRYDTLRGDGRTASGTNGVCHGAWNLLIGDGLFTVTVRDLNRPASYHPDTHGPEPVVFGREAAACDLLWDIVSRLDSAGSVQAVTSAELDPVARDWLHECGWHPPVQLYGNPFVATRDRQSFRIAQRAGRFELHLHDHSVPKLGAPAYAADCLADVTRILMTEVGNRSAPRPTGWPNAVFRVGWADEVALAVLHAMDFAAIRQAYRTQRPGPPLRIIAEGPDLSLVTPDLVERAERNGYPLHRYVNTTESAGFGSDERYVIRRHHDPLRYTLDRYGERSNRPTTVLTTEGLAPIHAYLEQRFGR
ncbi:hypothetical protein [Catellatospora sp. NPDC049609]|uniref:hypothetical protein n=1 Tax=Catellatospora sp. NPDC049609 TaxID=3155505 RepID=UPI0034187622